jgi:transposase InsO family protein
MCSIDGEDDEARLKRLQRGDPDLWKRRDWKGFTIENNVLLKDGCTAVPLPMRRQVMEEAHDKAGAHEHASLTLDRLRQDFYWPNMSTDVDEFVNSCQRCNRMRRNHKPNALQQPIEVSRPYEICGIDITHMPVSRRGNSHALVVMDHFTRFVEIFPLDDITAESVAQKLYDEVFTRYGRHFWSRTTGKNSVTPFCNTWPS